MYCTFQPVWETTYSEGFRFSSNNKDLVGISEHTVEFLRHQLTVSSILEASNWDSDDHRFITCKCLLHRSFNRIKAELR